MIIGLSIWVTKLTKRLKKYEDSRIHNVNNVQISNNGQPFVYKISNQSTSNEPQTKPYSTVKVLETNNVSSPSRISQNLPVHPTRGHHAVPHIVLHPEVHHYTNNRTNLHT